MPVLLRMFASHQVRGWWLVDRARSLLLGAGRLPVSIVRTASDIFAQMPFPLPHCWLGRCFGMKGIVKYSGTLLAPVALWHLVLACLLLCRVDSCELGKSYRLLRQEVRDSCAQAHVKASCVVLRSCVCLRQLRMTLLQVFCWGNWIPWEEVWVSWRRSFTSARCLPLPSPGSEHARLRAVRVDL